ncbi:hypothetical protein Tco_0662983 [Tanacetum coccineum]
MGETELASTKVVDKALVAETTTGPPDVLSSPTKFSANSGLIEGTIASEIDNRWSGILLESFKKPTGIELRPEEKDRNKSPITNLVLPTGGYGKHELLSESWARRGKSMTHKAFTAET